MKLWKKASAALKDNNSICLAKLARKTNSRHAELEEAIIKATSHDEHSVDYKNAQRVFAWIRTSPAFVKPFLCSLTKRMEKTRSWVVALKGLMLIHGVFCCRIPTVKFGRLPFDLSDFKDGHSSSAKTWGFNAFIRAYFAFLDQRSASLNGDGHPPVLSGGESMEKSPKLKQVLLELQQLQTLLDLLMQIRPHTDRMRVMLILEAMDCIILEIFDAYSSICNGIAGVLAGIFSAGKVEAAVALQVLKKAASQAGELSSYFEICRDFGVLNTSEIPRVQHIPEEDIRDLERMINGVSLDKKAITATSAAAAAAAGAFHGDKAIVVRDYQMVEQQKDPRNFLQTIITSDWVVFDDEFKPRGDELDIFCDVGNTYRVDHNVGNTDLVDPFAASFNFPLLEGYTDVSITYSKDLILY
ncbi:PREDICTED: putative clathrin assembly protein At1g25240 [Nelumbo nucifera]|uniref:Clathrin assembly protein At1g25240 n=1 Tax=Nelumbo nucifera TaxID=4432 RepID=A0A1U7ZA97_NELNU|nr:PREDICTED: putative clathrin assembly protein At1g25240 [Nelumbo nucifera]